MKNLLLILSFGFTSLFSPVKTASIADSKIVGEWKNANPNETLKEIDFYPNGSITMRSNTDNNISRYHLIKQTDSDLITGKIHWYPDVTFTAKIINSEKMDLETNYQGITKTIRLVKINDINSGFQLIR